MSYYAADLAFIGYRPVAPSTGAEQIDGEIIEKMHCSECGGQMRYEPYTLRSPDRPRRVVSYIALAVCVDCGREVEF